MTQDLYPPEVGPEQHPAAPESAGPAPPPTTSASNTLAIIALVLGGIAILTAFIPFIGAAIALPAGLAAIVLGLVARTKAESLGGGGLALAGVITGALGVVITLLWFVVGGLFFSSVETELEQFLEDVPIVDPEVADPGEAPATDTAPEAGALWTEPVTGEFWYAGMRVELSEAELLAGEWGDAQLHLRGMFENLTGDTLSYLDPGGFWLEVDGTLIDAGWESTLEAVPAGGMNRGTLVFDVAEGTTLDGAVLYAGSASEHRAVVPLDGAGEAVANAPYDAGVTGSLHAGSTTLAVTGSEIRTYNASFQQLDADRLYLELEIDLTYAGDRGSTAIGSEQFRLSMPDGRTVSPTLYPIMTLDPGSTERGALLGFEIDDPPDGDYGLTFEEWADDGIATLEFTL
jgi:hypothetical protein